MFTGIIEGLGTVEAIEKEGENYHFTIASAISDELKIDQSISHNGACLTVVKQQPGRHIVTAIKETMVKTNLGAVSVGDFVNLERAMQADARLDGHWVQGHVDTTGTCVSVESADGSWYYTFKYDVSPEHLLVDKGSVCVNGVSLTVCEPVEDRFSVAIIPYTQEHTTFKSIQVGTKINLEFDILGKYISRYLKLYMDKVK